jgi:hypothetical protein
MTAPLPAAADQALLSVFPTEHEHLGLRNLGLREWNLQVNMTWECSIKVLVVMMSPYIKYAWCKDWSHRIVCHRCGWLKDSACWYSNWGKGHRVLYQCARCLRWLSSFTWCCHSNDTAVQLLDIMWQVEDPSHLEYDACGCLRLAWSGNRTFVTRMESECTLWPLYILDHRKLDPLGPLETSQSF